MDCYPCATEQCNTRHCPCACHERNDVINISKPDDGSLHVDNPGCGVEWQHDDTGLGRCGCAEPMSNLPIDVCDDCGALVPSSYRQHHRDWHSDLDDRLNPREGV